VVLGAVPKDPIGGSQGVAVEIEIMLNPKDHRRIGENKPGSDNKMAN
jgi:hypothetical protein